MVTLTAPLRHPPLPYREGEGWWRKVLGSEYEVAQRWTYFCRARGDRRDGEHRVSSKALIWPNPVSGASELEIYRNG
jgi:hypothetical protein